jgi:hypothetical protein
MEVAKMSGSGIFEVPKCGLLVALAVIFLLLGLPESTSATGRHGTLSETPNLV